MCPVLIDKKDLLCIRDYILHALEHAVCRGLMLEAIRCGFGLAQVFIAALIE